MARTGERHLLIKIDGDVKGAQGAFGQLESMGSGLGSKLASVGKVIGRSLVAGGALAAAGAVKATTEASALQDVMAKSSAVFGDQAGVIEKWAAGAASSFGASKKQALGAASGFGNLFTQLGIGQKDAAGMSQQLTELGGDLRAFHGGDLTDVLDSMSAAFRGEYDSVQKFIPTINAAAVEQKALEMGLASTTKELDAQDKALATQALLMEGAGQAVGASGREAGSFAGQMERAKATIGNVVDELGSRFLPIGEELLTFVNDRILPGIQGFIDGFGDAGSGVGGFATRIGELAGTVGDIVGPVITDFIAFFRDQAIPTFQVVADTVGTLLKDGFDSVKKAIDENRPQIEALVGALGNVAKFIVGTVLPVAAVLIGVLYRVALEAIGTLINWLGKIIGAVQGAASWLGSLSVAVENAGRAVGTWIGNAVEAITGLPGKAAAALSGIGSTLMESGKKLVQGFIDGVKAKFEDVKKKLAELTALLPDWKGPAALDARILYGSGELVMGGFEKGIRSQFPAIQSTLGELTGSLPGLAFTPAGAAIRSTAHTDARTINVTVNPPPGMDPDDVVSALMRWSRRNGRLPMKAAR